ncbi:MAG TPA: tRNA dihydrouridine synthase DusB [Planctomycetota bacterium]|nr:tRNA dihydrouridine synthase DusB [Planctomycetota bacterium]
MNFAFPPVDTIAAHATPKIKRQVKPVRLGPLLIDPPVFQAPMAGFTNYVYRQIVREFGGVGLQATEMISAEGFLHQVGGLKGCIERLWGVKDEARPLAVQMWDNDPHTLAEVGKKLAFDYNVSVVDLNFGCPVKKVTEKAHSGSYLLKNPARVGEIVSTVVKACAPVPVTAKIRLGCTRKEMTAKDVARAVEDAGAAALYVHGRVAEDFFSGSADWERIAELKSILTKIPLIGNGDLSSAARVVTAFEKYEVDGVMIGRAALGRPWLFKQAAQALRGEPVMPDPTLAEQAALLLRHQRLVVERFGEERGNILMRKYACCYAQGVRGAREFRALASRCETNAEFEAIVRDHFPKDGVHRHEAVISPAQVDKACCDL